MSSFRSKFNSDKCSKFKASSCFSREPVSFEWRIENFSLCAAKEGEHIESPLFNSSDATWKLRLFPNGNKRTFGEIGIYLVKHSSDKKELSVQCNMGLKGKNTTIDRAFKYERIFDDKSVWGFSAVIERSELLGKEKEKFLPDDTLTIWCEFRIAKDIQHGDMICFEEESRPRCASISCLDELSEEFSASYTLQKNCDVILKADGKSLPAHKFVLGARSSVFAAMFVHDMREKESNVVEITDVGAATLNDMLWYMYSGKVASISTEKAMKLYAVADKYALGSLKKQCANFMKAGMTVENFYEVVVIADIYNDVELYDAASNFFHTNLSVILEAEQWDTVINENPRVALRLLKTASAYTRAKKGN